MSGGIHFPKKHHGFREKLFIIIFGTETRMGRFFDIALLYIILASILAVMLESVQELNAKYSSLFTIMEWTFTIFFTIEYTMRLWVVRNPIKYARSFLGIVDLFSILPTYLTLFVTGGSYFVVIRAVRLLRVFRILKLSRHLGEARELGDALAASRYKITIFLGSVTSLVIIMGTLMYMIEGGENGFTSIPRSIYWAIVTVTTVGYGDIAPQTVIGQFTASLLMLMGYAIIAVPTGIVTSEITMAGMKKKKKKESQRDQVCRHCGSISGGDAIFCHHCGEVFPVRTKPEDET